MEGGKGLVGIGDGRFFLCGFIEVLLRSALSIILVVLRPPNVFLRVVRWVVLSQAVTRFSTVVVLPGGVILVFLDVIVVVVDEEGAEVVD